jgi:TatD DNase family protein
LCRYRECWESGGGVVHSFTDTIQLAERFTTDLNLSIGLNGCSLKTEQNLETVRKLPLDRILLETE